MHASETTQRARNETIERDARLQALKTTGDLGKMQRKREKENEGERKDRIRKGSETEESKKLETEKERKRRKVGEK